MGIEELATVVTGEFGWFNFMLILIAVISVVSAFVNYREVKQLRNDIYDIKWQVEDINRRRR